MLVESNTRKVARLLADRPSMTMKSLVVESGLTKKQVENCLHQLSASGAVELIPRRYELTRKGREDLASPNGFPARSPRGMGPRSRVRQEEAELPIDANSIVGFAKINRHALDIAWRPACT